MFDGLSAQKRGRAAASFFFLSLVFLGANVCRIESADADPFQAALTQLKDKNPQIRRQGAEVLGRLRNPAAADSLKKLLSDPTPAVRSEAAGSLGLMRLVSVSSDIARLLQSDPDDGVRHQAAISLGYICDPKTGPALQKALKDKDPGTRYSAANSLGILRDESATQALVGELKSADPNMRATVAYVLGNVRSPASIPGMVDALKVSLSTAPSAEEMPFVNAAVGAAIVRSLGLIGDPSVVPALKKYLADKDKKVRVETALALARLGNDGGLSTARMFTGDSDGYNRRTAAETLAILGDETDLKSLKKLTEDPDGQVKQAATIALDKLKKKALSAAPKKYAAPSSSKKANP